MSIYCDCSYDCDECPDFSHEELRKARKPHKCIECRRTIAPGSLYEYATLICDGRVSHYKTCLTCRAIRRDYCPHGWIYGEVANHIHDCLGFDYRSDPSEWDQEEVDDEDEAHRARVLALLEKQREQREESVTQ